MGPPNTRIYQLPIEIQLEILKLLPICDRKSARVVCLTWNRILDRILKFRVYLTQDQMSCFKQFPNRVHTVRMGNLPHLLKLTPDDTKILSETTALELSNFNRFGIRQNIKASKNISENIETILKVCKNISSLYITGEFLASVVLTAPLNLRKIRLETLTHLKVNLDEIKDDVLLNAVSCIQCPNLSSMELHRSSICHCCGHLFDVPTFNAVFQLIKAHSKTLTKLKMSNTIAAMVRLFHHSVQGRLRERQDSNGMRERVSYFIVEEPISFHPLNELKLECLEVIHPAETFGSNWKLAEAIIRNQFALKRLKIVIKYFHFYRDLMQLVRQNAQTLECLEVDQRMAVFGYHLPLLLDLDLLRTCVSLQEIRIASSYSPLNITSLPRTLKKITWSGRLAYEQVRFLASHLKNLQTITLDHVFLDRPTDRYPHQGPRVNSAYFDVDILKDFHKLPKLATLRFCHCDTGQYLFTLEQYCKSSSGVTMKLGHQNVNDDAHPIESCRGDIEFLTFNFHHKD